jgi:hypothetical protein
MPINVPDLENVLLDAYVNKKMTMRQVTNLIGCSTVTVFNYLKKFGIPSRDKSYYMKGRKLSEEHCRKISMIHKGKIVSDETRRKISDARKTKHFPSPNWKGGKRTGRTDEYVQIYKPDHPNASKEGYVMEHRFVMEQFLGRLLVEDEVVHHINGIRADNRIENLQLMRHGEHTRYHGLKRWEAIRNAQ